jgi:hypothetical protein
MTSDLTYGQLYDKLRALGFTQRRLELYGLPRYVFEHQTLPNALLILPERDRDEQVEPFHRVSALATLRTHRLLPECDPLRP